MNRSTPSKWALFILQAFNGLSAVLGGYMLLKDPSGTDLGLQLGWLEGTPFSSFLIPGLVLLVMNGLGNLLGAGLTLRRWRQAGNYGLLFGLIMMSWIMAQVAWIGYQGFLQPLYFGTGMVQFAFGYLHQYRTDLEPGKNR